MEKAELQHTTKNAGIIGLSAFLASLVSLGLQAATAYYFGASEETDIFIMAQSFSELLVKFFLGGSIIAIFIPLFIEEIHKKNRASAWHTTLIIIHTLAAAYCLLLLLTAIFAPVAVAMIAPGFSEAAQQTTVHLLRIMIPAFFALFLVDFGTTILQAVKHFSIPASLRIVAPAASLVTIMLFAKHIGLSALAYGALAGSLIQVALIFYALKKQGFTYSFIWQPFAPIMRKLLILVSPFILSMIVTMLAGILYRVLASNLEPGSLSAIKYAEKITQQLMTIFLTSFVVVLYPILSEKATRHGAKAMLPTLGAASRLIFFIGIPLVVSTVVLRIPLIQLLFERGNFTPEDTALTSIALFYLVIGLPVNAISSLFGNATMALQKTKAAVAVTAASQVVAIILFSVLTPRLGLAGLALASSLLPVAIALMYLGYLRQHIPTIFQIFWHKTYGLALLLGLLLAVVMTYTYALATRLPLMGNASLIMQILLPVVVGGIVYGGGAYLLGIHEVREVVNIAQSKLEKYRKTV